MKFTKMTFDTRSRCALVHEKKALLLKGGGVQHPPDKHEYTMKICTLAERR